jgi:hypothetical protein
MSIYTFYGLFCDDPKMIPKPGQPIKVDMKDLDFDPTKFTCDLGTYDISLWYHNGDYDFSFLNAPTTLRVSLDSATNEYVETDRDGQEIARVPVDFKRGDPGTGVSDYFDWLTLSTMYEVVSDPTTYPPCATKPEDLEPPIEEPNIFEFEVTDADGNPILDANGNTINIGTSGGYDKPIEPVKGETGHEGETQAEYDARLEEYNNTLANWQKFWPAYELAVKTYGHAQYQYQAYWGPACDAAYADMKDYIDHELAAAMITNSYYRRKNRQEKLEYNQAFSDAVRNQCAQQSALAKSEGEHKAQVMKAQNQSMQRSQSEKKAIEQKLISRMMQKWSQNSAEGNKKK